MALERLGAGEGGYGIDLRGGPAGEVLDAIRSFGI